MYKKIIIYFIIVIIIFFVFDLWQKLYSQQIVYFDVGQGDTELIKLGEIEILIDVGPDCKILNRLGSVMSFIDRSIEHIVISHAHQDHFMGLYCFVGKYDIKNIWISPEKNNNKYYNNILSILKKGGTKIHIANPPNMVFQNKQATIKIIYPNRNLVFKKSVINNQSVVVLFKYKSNQYLFTGDIEKEGESVLKNLLSAPIKILKVGHHGSRTSSSLSFLEKIKPEFAVISVGKNNKYHHPHAEVLNRLRSLGIIIFRTDLLGSVLFDLKTSRWHYGSL